MSIQDSRWCSSRLCLCSPSVYHLHPWSHCSHPLHMFEINLFADDIVIWASWVSHWQLHQLCHAWTCNWHSTNCHMGIHMEDHVLILKNTNDHILCCCIPSPCMEHIQTHIISLHHHHCWHIHISWTHTAQTTRLDPTHQRNHTQSNSNITPDCPPCILHHPSRPSLPVIRQLIHTVLIPKIAYGLPFINLYPNPTHPLMLQLKRLLIIPLRRSLGLPHNAHHDSIFIETRTLPIPYIQIYHSLLFARRYIKQATSPQQQQQTIWPTLQHHHTHDILAFAPIDPLFRDCSPLPGHDMSITSTMSRLQQARVDSCGMLCLTSSIMCGITSQHPTTRTSPDNTHSLFPCYVSMPVMPNTSLPSYFLILSPSDASVVSRLRFNRARLNQSLNKRRVSPPTSVPHVRCCWNSWTCCDVLSSLWCYFVSLFLLIGCHYQTAPSVFFLSVSLSFVFLSLSCNQRAFHSVCSYHFFFPLLCSSYAWHVIIICSVSTFVFGHRT